MDYVNLGRTGVKVSRICLGCMSYGVPPAGPLRPGSNAWSLNEEQSQPFFRQALDAGNQFLRHRERLLDRRQRARARPLPEGQCKARRHGDRDQAERRDARWPQRRRTLAQGDFFRDRRIAAPPGHRLRRSLPDPSLGQHHPDRGDAGGAQRCGARGQGALSGRFVHVGVAVLQGALPRRPAWLVALRHHAAPLQPALPRGGARDVAPLSRPGHRRAAVESAGARQAGSSVGRGGDQALRLRRLRQVALCQDGWRRTSAWWTGSANWPARAELRGRRLLWPGC